MIADAPVGIAHELADEAPGLVLGAAPAVHHDLPALTPRQVRALDSIPFGGTYPAHLGRRLDVHADTARGLLHSLRKLGLLTEDDRGDFHLTSKGRQCRLALISP